MEFLVSCPLADVLSLGPALLQDPATQGRAAAHLLVRLRECTDDSEDTCQKVIRLISTFYTPEPAYSAQAISSGHSECLRAFARCTACIYARIQFIELLDCSPFVTTIVTSLSRMVPDPSNELLGLVIQKYKELVALDRALLVPVIAPSTAHHALFHSPYVCPTTTMQRTMHRITHRARTMPPCNTGGRVTR